MSRARAADWRGALFVAPDAARQGIGSALIGEVKH